jgi:hypothetical protein
LLLLVLVLRRRISVHARLLLLHQHPTPLAAAAVCADNLVSKLNAQKGATAGDIIKQMGWYSLFTRGLGLRIIMIGTLTGLQVRVGVARSWGSLVLPT